MKFNYDKSTDALYISFIDEAGIDSFEISPDYIADVDSVGNIVGIEVLNVKTKVDFDKFIFSQIPLKDVRFINQEVVA